PKVFWQQSSNGKWTVPSAPKEPSVRKSSPTPAPGSVAESAEVVPEKKPSRPLFTVEVKQFKVKRGSFDFRSNDAQPIAALSGIDVSADLSGESEAKGVA